jgi:hypothetical protein
MSVQFVTLIFMTTPKKVQEPQEIIVSGKIGVFKDSDQLPDSFEEAVRRVRQFALQEFEKEITQKQLYYHTCEHVNTVQRRADQIFQVVRPYWEALLESGTGSDYLTRMKLLLDLCAIAHDVVQEFVPQTQSHTSRRRDSGVSERATIYKLIKYIEALNKQVQRQDPDSLALFQDSELRIIKEAIEATICLYDPADQAIYQPDLYDPKKNVSPVARMIALADIGSLGMEGIESYNQEGSLLFLEENPDVIPILADGEIQQLDPELYENFRQRLLRRVRFQVHFAKSRLVRYKHELEGFPAKAIPILIDKVFKHLRPETIREVETTTPTAEDTTLEQLIQFFELEKYVRNYVKE